RRLATSALLLLSLLPHGHASANASGKESKEFVSSDGSPPAKTVIEYFCDEGYALKGDYKFLTCQNGEWDAAMQITCRLSQDKELRSPLAMPALSIVASTASSVALLLLLVVLFVLLQPKLKSFHHSSGGASLPPPPESRVQIVLSEGPQGAEGGAEVLGPSNRFQSHHHRDRDTELCLPSTSTSSSSFPSSSRHSETVLVHQAPSRSSSSSSSWVTEHGGGACGGAAPVVTLARRRDSESSDQHSLQSVTSVDDFSDGSLKPPAAPPLPPTADQETLRLLLGPTGAFYLNYTTLTYSSKTQNYKMTRRSKDRN
ncbi:unnamed protein product, partial [Coregonus sp. 'balchen']